MICNSKAIEMRIQFAAVVFFCYLSLCVGCIAPELQKIFIGSGTKYKLNTAYLEPEHLIRQKGYPSEKHTVQTEDGYLLSMHRIPRGIRGNSTTRKGPIFLQHGFLMQSVDWLLQKPENDLAFILADKGYDVWLGNFRGNTHSRAHVSLTPCQKEFWNYTWHESGLYDLPAMIDYVLETTKANKLEYIGHSMGTTTFFVLMSMRPEYNEKITKAHLLAPVAFLKNLRSPLLKAATRITKYYSMFAEIFTTGALLPDSDAFKLLRKTVCDMTSVKNEMCTQGLFLIVGADDEQFDKDLLAAILYHYPSGYSVKGLNHFTQVHLSGEFKQYDYGYVKNIRYYGSGKPPSYNFKKITAPIVMYAALNDNLSTMDDAFQISTALSSLEELHVVKFAKFNHMDFLFAIDAKTLLYDEILKRLTQSTK